MGNLITHKQSQWLPLLPIQRLSSPPSPPPTQSPPTLSQMPSRPPFRLLMPPPPPPPRTSRLPSRATALRTLPPMALLPTTGVSHGTCNSVPPNTTPLVPKLGKGGSPHKGSLAKPLNTLTTS